ncbi:MAG TPA: hypothetical protein DCY85_13110 [Firmicutes bacterium]|nr:hypothetical protein [Bacillota bacterium]HAW70124.1 hypothetical protein [Bacillota bacterium]HAZ21317.1 hypothetical protein [Bacillota bacterium]HBE07412.1 hypothetical protein [Bacillota bacterium]HBG44987.1 hypothetical protein [Bacillota bacterium]
MDNNFPLIFSLILNAVQLVLLIALAVMYLKARGKADELDNLGKIRRIAELHQDGILDDEEYKTKKRDLMGKV